MFERTLRERARQIARNTVAISMAESLQYLLITVNVAGLEKVSCSDTQNPKSVC